MKKEQSSLAAFMEEQETRKPGEKTQKKGHKTRRHHHDDLMAKKAQTKHDELNKNSQYRSNFKREE